MGGYDEQVAIMGEWIPPSPNQRSLLSPMIANDVAPSSVANSCNEGMHEPTNPVMEVKDSLGDAVKNDLATQASMGGYEASDSNVLGGSKMGSRGCLRERMAARAGFNAPRLNTENIKPADLSKNPEVRSPYLTIPPGLSPTCLLDSPVFLSNTLAVPSPTTGKFLFGLSGNNDIPTLVTDDRNNGKENAFNDPSSFAFKPIAESRLVPSFDAANTVHASGFGSQSFPSFAVSYHSDTSLLHPSVEPPNFQGFPKLQVENVGNNLSPVQTDSAGVTESSPRLDELSEDDGDQRSGEDPNNVGDEADDGYNWRKYGQKQVKGSEYPRSYFKCTYSNCPMKKKVERSHEGHVTEIIYKGNHNHPKPSHRSTLGSSNALGGIQLDSEGAQAGANGNLIWSAMQKGTLSGAAGWGQENLEVKPSASMVQEYGKGATFPGPNGLYHESGDGVDQSSTLSNEEGDDDHVTHGSISLGYDGEGDESESKRRRIDTYPLEISGATRAIREPRVVVQTTSDVDILDDGYRWRKYGQKVVKGNPNPRSYYKCTSPGCNVRKHVERASHDLKSVITTYEGKHNHDVPAARNSGSSQHTNSGNSNPPPSQHHHQQTATAVSSTVPSHNLPRHADLLQIHSLQSCLSQFGKIPMDPFSFPGKPRLEHPGPGFRFGTNHPGLAGLGMGMGRGMGMGMGMGALGKFPGLPMLQQRNTNAYMGNQGQVMNGMGYVVPKTEPKLEGVTESTISAAANGSSAVYQQLMSQMPLGEQM